MTKGVQITEDAQYHTQLCTLSLLAGWLVTDHNMHVQAYSPQWSKSGLEKANGHQVSVLLYSGIHADNFRWEHCNKYKYNM